MRKYETLIAFDTHFNDERITQEVEKMKGLLAENSAQNISIDKWGRKELAHPVKNRAYGAYFVFNYETDNHSIIDRINKVLRIDDGVLKFQTHRLGAPKRKFKGRNIKEESSAA